MNAKAHNILNRYGRFYFLAVEILVVTTQLLRLLSLDTRGHSSLLPHHATDISTMIFRYAFDASVLLLLCSLPIFFKINRRTGYIALTTLIVVVLIALLTPEL
jgi:hypothetical protein